MIKVIKSLKVAQKIIISILIGLALTIVAGTLLFLQTYNGESPATEKIEAKKTVTDINTASFTQSRENQLKLLPISQRKDISVHPGPSSDEEVEKTESEADNEGFEYLAEIPLSEELQQLVFDRCKEEGLDYHLVLGLIWRESRFDVNAVGYNTNGTVDTGLMQINDANRSFLRDNYGIDNLFDPAQNVLAGTSLLGDWAEKHGQHYAIMAYRSGEYGMMSKRAGGITTDWSVEIVYEKGEEYLALLEEARNR